MKPVLAIEAYFDLICPWCLIGRRHLETAVHRFSRLHPEVETAIDWRPHLLLPGTPADGLPYQAFYERRLGGPEAVAARRAQVQEAARPAAIEFAFDRIRMLPNTLAAHRLIGYAGRHGGVDRKEALIDALFAAYFLDGENIGDHGVLARIAAGRGFPENAVAAYLASGEGIRQFLEQQAAPGSSRVTGVPFYVFNDRLALSGAHPPEALLEVMEQALPGSTSRAADDPLTDFRRRVPRGLAMKP